MLFNLFHTKEDQVSTGSCFICQNLSSRFEVQYQILHTMLCWISPNILEPVSCNGWKLFLFKPVHWHVITILLTPIIQWVLYIVQVAAPKIAGPICSIAAWLMWLGSQLGWNDLIVCWLWLKNHLNCMDLGSTILVKLGAG